MTWTVTLFVTVRTHNLVKLAYVEKAKTRAFPRHSAKLLTWQERHIGRAYYF